MPNSLENIPPRFARISVAFKFREGRVEDLPLSLAGFVAGDQIGFMQFREPRK
jgi:hypothetical protein